MSNVSLLRKFPIMALLLLSLPLFLAASGNNTVAPPDTTGIIIHPAGKWALQFQIGENFSLNAFQGGVSVKRQLSDVGAIRLTTDLGADIEDEGQESYLEDALRWKETDRVDVYTLSLAVAYLRYITGASNVRPYWGAGPILIGSITGREHSREEPAGSTTSQLTFNIRIGGSGLVGAEWFVAKNISLIAEYGIRLIYHRYVNKQVVDEGEDSISEDITYLNGVELDRESLRFGVSVYF
jgi:hypothetical protein